jgi:hypothetical protein
MEGASLHDLHWVLHILPDHLPSNILWLLQHGMETRLLGGEDKRPCLRGKENSLHVWYGQGKRKRETYALDELQQAVYTFYNESNSPVFFLCCFLVSS